MDHFVREVESKTEKWRQVFINVSVCFLCHIRYCNVIFTFVPLGMVLGRPQKALCYFRTNALIGLINRNYTLISHEESIEEQINIKGISGEELYKHFASVRILMY